MRRLDFSEPLEIADIVAEIVELAEFGGEVLHLI
jgi:hypothetical protein